MRAGSGRQARWLLLCALALAVVGMHHLALAPHEATPDGTHATAMMSVAGAPADAPVAPRIDSATYPATGAGHDLMHLCLAVLFSTGGLLFLAWLLIAVGGPPPKSLASILVLASRRRRSPGPAGRALLTSVCLLRI